MILSSFPVEQEGALSDEEIQARADKEGLDQLREKFDDLEEELEREAEEDENLPEGVERMIQGMIRLCRQMMVAAADKEAEFWSKMKQLEVRQNIESFKKDRKLYLCSPGPVLPDEKCVSRHSCFIEGLGDRRLPNHE